MLTDVAVRDWGTEVLGTRLNAPVLLGPVGVLSIVHPDAELAVARAAAATGAGMVLSRRRRRAWRTSPQRPATRRAGSSSTGRATPSSWPAWSAGRRRPATTAIVVTLDTRLMPWRPKDLTGAYLPFLLGEGLANYTSDPVFRARLAAAPEDDPGAAVGQWAQVFPNPSLTWEDLPRLRRAHVAADPRQGRPAPR